MWVRGIARGALVVITAFLSAAVHANDAAHEMAERFAGDATGAVAKPQATPTAATEAKSAAEPADAPTREAERAVRGSEIGKAACGIGRLSRPIRPSNPTSSVCSAQGSQHLGRRHR